MKIATFKRSIFILVICFLAPSIMSGQDTTFRKQYEQEYAQRITQSQINGRYIPKDLDEAMLELDNLVDMVGKAKFKAQPESQAVRKLHFSFGKWMIVNWGFYDGSRLSHYLRGKGITHPDDMATILMTCYHRHLHQIPLGFEELASECEARRRKEVTERLMQGEILQTKTIPKN